MNPKLPRRIQKIFRRASSPKGEGLPLISTSWKDPLSVEDIEKGRITSRKQKIRALRRKEIIRKRNEILSALWGISVELGQLEEIALRGSNSHVLNTGLGEHLTPEDRRQFIRITSRIDERPAYYGYSMQRLRFIALNLPVPSRLSGKVI